jgi:hypothetical protein
MFYPGVASFADAKSIVVGDGEKLIGVEIRFAAEKGKTVEKSPGYSLRF